VWVCEALRERRPPGLLRSQLVGPSRFSPAHGSFKVPLVHLVAPKTNGYLSSESQSR